MDGSTEGSGLGKFSEQVWGELRERGHMAAETRTTLDTVIHSDHGPQFTAWAFTENVRRLGLLGSMGTVGDCYDNAPMESFWGSMQIELLDRQRWTTRIELSAAIADYIGFYNADRRHSSLGYLTPNEHDHLHSTDHLARSS